MSALPVAVANSNTDFGDVCAKPAPRLRVICGKKVMGNTSAVMATGKTVPRFQVSQAQSKFVIAKTKAIVYPRSKVGLFNARVGIFLKTSLWAVAFAVAVCLGGVAGLSFSPNEQVSAGDAHIVKEGETLWEVASRMQIHTEDVTETVSKIKILNGLSTSTIYPGQKLIMPAK